MVRTPHRVLLLLVLPLVPVTTSCGQAVSPGPRLDREARNLLMEDLRWLADDARNGRRAGSEDAEAVREWLVRRFSEAGFEASVMPFDLGDGRSGGNVWVTVPGRGDGEDVIVVTAHYDHVGVRNGMVYNGADDNASGTAALLALAARLHSNPPSHTILLVALDAEESGLLGAEAFVRNPPIPLDRIALNVNLDMLGRSESGELYAAGPGRYPSLRAPIETVAEMAPIRLLLGHDDPTHGRDDWTMQSDQGAFHAVGIPFVYFGVEDHEDYHRPTDDADRIDGDFYTGAVETVLLAVEVLDRQGPSWHAKD